MSISNSTGCSPSGFNPARSGVLPVPEKKEQVLVVSTPSGDPARDLALRVRSVSQLDLNTEFDLSTWAVTVVIDKAFPGFHARIVIEGIDEKIGPFFQIAHLQGNMCRDIKTISDCWFCFTGIGQVRLNKPKNPPMNLSSYKSRTETWVRPREKVQNMIGQILKEEEAGAVQPFSLLGRTSMFSKEVEFFETEHPTLLELKEKDPGNFARLYRMHENSDTRRNKYLFIVACDGYIGRVRSIQNPFLYAGAELVMGPFTIPLLVGALALDLPRRSFEDYRYLKNADILNLMKEHVKKVTKIPDSCFTWAFQKLKIIDVEVSGCFLDRCMAVSTLYANKPINEPDKNSVQS